MASNKLIRANMLNKVVRPMHAMCPFTIPKIRYFLFNEILSSKIFGCKSTQVFLYHAPLTEIDKMVNG